MSAPALAGLVGLLLLAGCASVRMVPAPRLTAVPPCLVPAPSRELLVGVALSGGGSRAALFGAAGLEALGTVRMPDGSSLLEHVALLSSVSGGSLAATYYAVNKPPRAVPVLGPDGTLSTVYRDFFARSTAKLGQDFERELIRRQLTSFRWLNSSLVAWSLFEVLRARLLGETTVQDVSRRQASGDSPGLIINTTLYNNGRRLAGLVTASASFPPLVGPLTFHGGGEVYWHAADGGLYENQGIESLLFLFLRQLQEQRARRALILAFDSSFPFSVGDRRLSRRAQPFSLFTFDFSRVPSIMEERASTYQALFFKSLQLEGVFPDEHSARVLQLRHIDAQWRSDLADLPPACRGERPPLASPAAVVERIAEIPTRLRVKSECDRQLLATAAAKVVAQRRGEVTEFLAGGATASMPGPIPHTGPVPAGGRRRGAPRRPRR